ncbi:MAG: cohesin domain-containing protein [Acutalibacteraceae bacterium]
MKNDVDLSGIEWVPIGDTIDYNHNTQNFFEVDSANYFTGKLDGNGFSIKNLTIKATESKQLEDYENDVSEYGLFTHISGAEIVNLNFENITLYVDVTDKTDFTDERHILSGVISGSASNSTIKNCQLKSGEIDADDISGSFTGSAGTSNIVNCINFVSGFMRGGIAGEGGIFDGCINKGDLCNASGGITSTPSGDIIRCTNYGNINTNENQVGGISARVWDCNIIGCANYGEITQGVVTGAIAGGIFGNGNPSNVYDCSNYGDITSSLYNLDGYITAEIGGICGKTNSKQISNCINTGEINVIDTDDSSSCNAYIGGIVGYYAYSSKDEVIFERLLNYGNINLSAEKSSSTISGIVGYNYDSSLAINISNTCNFGNISIDANFITQSCVSGIVCGGGIFKISYVSNEGDTNITADNIGLICGGLLSHLNAGSSITDSYNNGNCTVISNNSDEESKVYVGVDFGGIAGIIFDTEDSATPIVIKNTYFYGDVNLSDALNIGTLCSRNVKSVPINAENCYTTSTHSAKQIGSGDDCVNGNIQIINDWSNQSEFNGFDFISVWDLQNRTFPTLKSNNLTDIILPEITVTAGETFQVPVVIKSSETVYSGNFTLKYNSDLLSVNSFSYGSILSEHTKNCNLDHQSVGNLIRFTFSGSSALKSDGTLVTFTFTAKDNISGVAPVQFISNSIYNETGTAIVSNITNGTILIEKKLDTTEPVGSISSTNNVSTTQTVTLKLSDDVGIAGYYWGTNSTYTNNTYTTVSGSPTSTTVSKTISSNGIYYLTVKDNAGNISASVSATFYKTTLDANNGSVSPSYIITKSGNSFTFPTPIRNDYTYKGWSMSSDATSGVTILAPTSNTTYYAVWEQTVTPTITLSATSKSITIGDTATLIATTTPSGQTVTWTSSNTSVATVSNGVITTKATGFVTITAEFTYNGITYSKTCDVVVVDPEVHTHTYGNWIIDEEATCTVAGSKHKTCSNCGDVVIESINALGHNYSTEWTIDKAATCAKEGSKSHHCSRCDSVTDVTVIQPDYTKHEYSDWVIEKAATCDSAGRRVKMCAYCGDTVYDVIPALGHKYGDSVITKEPTCVNDGSQRKTCSTCGDVLTNSIPAVGHNYSTEWIIDKAANCTEYGSKSHHCLNCDDKTDITVIAPTGHKSSDWITDKEATVNSAGSKHKECTVCGEVLETATIPQLTCSEPKLTKIENASNGIKITWGKVSGAQSYNVYRKTYSNGKWSGWSGIKTGVTGTSYTDTTAKSGTTYAYTVRAKNAAGLSSYNTTGLKIKFLSTPKLSSISNGSGKVTAKWNKVTGASGYYVYRQTYSNGKWSGWKKVATTKDNYYNDTKVSSGNYYKYTVRAYNGSYMSYYNTTGLKTKYLAVTPLKSAVSQKDGIKVTWGKVTGAKGYVVYRQTYSNGKWSGWTKIKAISSGSTVTYTDKSAKKGVTYKYTVRATSDSYMGYYNTKGLQVKDKY